MSEEKNYQTIKRIMEQTQLVDATNVQHGGNFRCPMFLREEDKNTGIDALDLSVRSYNCLKRAGFNTMEDLITKVHCKDDLMKIRNCGHKSIQEILEKMFVYQLMSFPESKRLWYIVETIRRSQLG